MERGAVARSTLGGVGGMCLGRGATCDGVERKTAESGCVEREIWCGERLRQGMQVMSCMALVRQRRRGAEREDEDSKDGRFRSLHPRR